MEFANVELEKFGELVKSIKSGILISPIANRRMKGRLINTADVDEDGNIWIFTKEISPEDKAIIDQDEVYLNYINYLDGSYVLVNARVHLEDDQDKMQEFWKPWMRSLFPKGLADPKLNLLRLEPDQVEYCEKGINKVVIVFRMFSSLFGHSETAHD